MSKTKIEHTIRREGGTTVDMPSGNAYVFKPSADDPRHIAEVTDKADLARFIQVGSDLGTFRLVDGGNSLVPDAPVPGARREPGADVSVPEGETGTDTADQTTPPSQDAVEKSLKNLEEAELRDRFEAAVGRKPHANAKPETMIAQILAIEAAK